MEDQWPWLVSEAAQDLYVEAINCCLRGDLRAADRNLAALGCRWRLSGSVWAAAAAAATARDQEEQQQQPESPPRSSPCLVHDDLLPPAVLAALQAAFHARDSDFWSLHRYGEDETPFFSFLIDLRAATAPAAAAAAAAAPADGDAAAPAAAPAAAAAAAGGGSAAPACALELAAQVIQQHLRQLATQRQGDACLAAVASAAAEASHVEWWVHTRPPSAPHQLHFDSAEDAFRRGLAAFRLAHPAASCVVFLEAGAGAGPTLVLEQDTRGAWQQQQQQQQQEAVASESEGEEPSVKRARQADSRAAAAAAEPAPDARSQQQQHAHHHHHKRRHARHANSQQRPSLAAAGACIPARVGRVAVWPGCLLHGVLPGQPMPAAAGAGDDGPGAAGGEQSAAATGSTARGADTKPDAAAAAAVAAAAGGDGSDGWRTTLILAWWHGDPRLLSPAAAGAEAGTAGAGSSPVSGSPTAGTAAAGLGPCMSMPKLPAPATSQQGSSSSSIMPRWLQALQLSGQHLDPAAAAAVDGVGAGWRLLPAISPAWERVSRRPPQDAAAMAEQPAAAAAEGDEAGAAAAGDEPGIAAAAVDEAGDELQLVPLLVEGLPRAELPPLRFFLRWPGEIRAAYVPGLDDYWQQQEEGLEETAGCQ